MTLDEAEKLFKLFSSADGGCISCATALMDSFVESFPEFQYELTGEWYRDTAVVKLTQNEHVRRVPLPWMP